MAAAGLTRFANTHTNYFLTLKEEEKVKFQIQHLTSRLHVMLLVTIPSETPVQILGDFQLLCLY